MDNISHQEKELHNLLDWLSKDSEQAAAEYNKIRDGLIRFFRYKGCSDTEMLADMTLDRVAKKIHTFDKTNAVKKTTIITGFAIKIVFEHLRKKKNESAKLQKFELIKDSVYKKYNEENEIRIGCMKYCLQKLSDEDRKIFIEYYGQTKLKNSVARRNLAERLGWEPNALGVRIFRIRGILAECIEECEKKSL